MRLYIIRHAAPDYPNQSISAARHEEARGIEPVVEDCIMCHSPHGSVADNLLIANEPMVCLQCHELHFHTGYEAADDEVDVGGTEYESPWGGDGFTRGFTTKCTECHSQIHDTDLPSQTVPGRGRGLTR